MSELLTDPREIRKLLADIARRGGRIDGRRGGVGEMHASGLLASNVAILAEIQGYSGEDAMTVLAYLALLNYEMVLDRLLEDRKRMPRAHQVLTELEPPKKEGD